MQITRGNYSQYANMVQQMFGNKKNPNNPLAQCDYGNFALRFKPVDIQFTKPNWDNIMTKRDKPAMSEEEFEKAIKELAQKEFATGKRDDAAYRKLCMQHGETVSPDRKAIYESSMRKTGGKMNAACMFWDNNGNKTLSYNPESRNWKAISTEEEFARARVFTSIYNDELARLKKEYGENAKELYLISRYSLIWQQAKRHHLRTVHWIYRYNPTLYSAEMLKALSLWTARV